MTSSDDVWSGDKLWSGDNVRSCDNHWTRGNLRMAIGMYVIAATGFSDANYTKDIG